MESKNEGWREQGEEQGRALFFAYTLLLANLICTSSYLG
jgi:hypothetical protein